MRKFMVLLPLIALAGCAVGPSLQSRMAAYTGASAQTLVQQLGVPDKQITVNGVRYFAYVEHHTHLTPGFYGAGFGEFGGFYGSPFFGGPLIDAGIPPTINEFSCETTFMLKRDKVYGVTFRGNDCG